MCLDFPLQMRWHRSTRRSGPSRVGSRFWACLALLLGCGSLCHFHFFEPQLQLLDLLVQFLRAAAELQTLQLQDQQLQVFDFVIPCGEGGLLFY